MKHAFLVSVIFTFWAFYDCKLKDELGYCDPLTVEFLASMVYKEARYLFNVEVRPPHRDLSYHLYTPRNKYEPQVLRMNDVAALRRSHFNTSWPVRIKLHGWFGTTTQCPLQAIKDAYLDKGDFNVILVDWTDYSLDVNYVRVVAEFYEIGTKVHNFTKFLHKETGIAYKDMYLIGHSAGAHIIGVAAKLVKPDVYGVIYALDPARPVLESEMKWHLTPEDALYIESIHTDMALCGYFTDEIGHASFYPNWGLGQPHCPNVSITVPDFMCDHFGAVFFFVESIRNDKAFGAIKCKNFMKIQQQTCGCGQKHCKAQTFMGGEPAIPKRGIYYFSTRTRLPFGNGETCKMKKALDSTIVRYHLPFN